MTDLQKLIQKFLSDNQHITVEDCHRILIEFGFELRKSGGSHRVYHKKGAKPISIIDPKKTKYINSLYVRALVKDLGLEGLK
ncbi:type II toxin-antitoxin system HicA family toxin [Dehalogenimonas etheniformans]|uniref:Type II toxin-antitoxin system HicA family toxin n=1 Tax=Dehalogenimonas etheniformans TaxID=1536648 RepID=A0A2P5P6F7_9CHLR|nr:type II toxin-antitoxin system HicA family toxin [Dehalogenimonas etheniformans]QNT75461.1 type II toxin-antitoxin system HicA family toxin [Dehalogenimonas etheniformans]